jgi:hypothetical protein
VFYCIGRKGERGSGSKGSRTEDHPSDTKDGGDGTMSTRAGTIWGEEVGLLCCYPIIQGVDAGAGAIVVLHFESLYIRAWMDVLAM